MERTPYGVAQSRWLLGSSLAAHARDGYLFVFQDIRGRYGSKGQFVMNHPVCDPPRDGCVDEVTDTYDTVDWLLRNVSGNNGRVGVLGISYPGWLAGIAGVRPHPAVKAVSPQAPMTDTWMGDDFFHQGAFRLSYGFEYSSEMELSTDGSVEPPTGRYDTYDWYLAQGPLRNLTKRLAGRVPTWTAFTEHPAYDAYWKGRALTKSLTALAVPTLTVGGWYDQEDFFGPLATYRALERFDRQGVNQVVLGPWNHGGWARDGRRLGAVDFGSDVSGFYRDSVEAPWFAHWLKDRPALPLQEALVFEGGSNSWRRYDAWPAKEARPTALYFRRGGRLSFTAPPASEAGFDEYVSDPAHPVPYRARPIPRTYSPNSGWRSWLVEDQRFVDGRPDVLTWQTEPLDEDVVIAGDVAAKLFASTTGRDADWVVKLIDVLPDTVPGTPRMGGFEQMVSSDILRGRYHRSFERPEPLVPGRVTPFAVDLHQQAYRFRRGHRIMVQVQSTWFPVYDRNPQTWVPNIFEATAADFRKATHRVHRTPAAPSHVVLPLVGAAAP
jgi:putative CocE/NonD family hydrolase